MCTVIADLVMAEAEPALVSQKVETIYDIARFQSRVCDALEISNPLCSVFGSVAFHKFKLNVLRKLLARTARQKLDTLAVRGRYDSSTTVDWESLADDCDMGSEGQDGSIQAFMPNGACISLSSSFVLSYTQSFPHLPDENKRPHIPAAETESNTAHEQPAATESGDKGKRHKPL